MVIEEKKETPFIEFGEIFDTPIYKSEIIVGNLTIRLTKRFNWLNRLMFKVFFGLKITNIKEGS